MLKIIAVVMSVTQPGSIAVYVGQAEYGDEIACQADLPKARAAIAAAHARGGGEVSVEARCDTPEAIARMLDELSARHPGAVRRGAGGR